MSKSVSKKISTQELPFTDMLNKIKIKFIMSEIKRIKKAPLKWGLIFQ